MTHPTDPRRPIRGVIFDLDGTLISQALDFSAIRREIGLPDDHPLLESLEQLPPEEQERAWEILEHHELSGADLARELPGVRSFLDRLDERGLPRAVLSRNCRSAVERSLARCELGRFDPILTRDEAPYKPHPEGIWTICAAWGRRPDEVLMVGDYVYDLQAGRAAGTRTALITHGRDWPFAHQADFVFADFVEGLAKLGELLAP